MDRQARIDAMLDKHEITECLMRFTRGIDRHDTELARSAYHEDARDDHGAYIGTGYGLVDFAEMVHDASFSSHQHHVMNVSIELDGDEAHAECYVMLVARDKDGLGFSFGGGRYLDRLERRAGRWGIVDRVLTYEWWSDDEAFRHNGPLGHPFSQDRSDPSYARPLRVTREPRSTVMQFDPGSPVG